ncbi:hypothetical protein ACFOGJ_07420 [Marinibaculum pumilum]|uniref:SIR2-like domain-containing protein n=1 Tax=Marinibaculum pumilum TaxID=1766165 RepID=A0ABV7KXK9_9PROT
MNSIYSYRFDIVRKASTYDVLLVFSATPSLNSEALADLIESEVAQNLLPDEVIILVRDSEFNTTISELTKDSQNLATLARLGKRTSVTLIGYGCLGEELQRKQVNGQNPEANVTFSEFKRRALTSIFRARHGFVESTSTYHFENPSGRHTERFIRLSNILVRGAEIAFIGFCTLPYVPTHVRTAYLDTPSLYPVIAAINEQRSSFKNSKPILADNFSSYAGIRGYRFTHIKDSVLLISASSSGSLASKLIEEYGFTHNQVTHLLFLGNDHSRSNIVCDLYRDPVFNAEGIATLPSVERPENCKMCQTGSHAIKLQGDQFEFAGPQQEPLLIAKGDAPTGLAVLMDRFAGSKVFTVGLGQSVGRQPRQFNINSKFLLENRSFQDRFHYVIRRSMPASLRHVIAVDEVCIPFAEQIASAVSPEVQVIIRENIDNIPKSTTSSIVIAGLIIESGRNLLDVSRDLRSIVPEAPLMYLIGFSKTTGEPRRESLERTLVQTANPYPYQVIEVERMVLPLSSESNPWAAERRLLLDPEVKKLIPKNLQTAILKRVKRLSNSSTPLENELFVSNTVGDNLTLQPGFVFWPSGVPQRNHSQADVYFTIASVLQQLRANAHRTQKSAIKSNWFQQTVLAPGNFGRFNDDIIQASILRAAYPYEMNLTDSPSDSRELSRLIRRIIQAAKTERGGAASEFLLAIATGRVRLRQADLETALSAKPGNVPMVNFLLKVCQSRLLSQK